MQTLHPTALPTPIQPQHPQGHPLAGIQLPGSAAAQLPGDLQTVPSTPTPLFPRLTALLLHTLPHSPSHQPLDMLQSVLVPVPFCLLGLENFCSSFKTQCTYPLLCTGLPGTMLKPQL